MKTIQGLYYIQRLFIGTISLCVILSLLTACGGEDNSSSNSASPASVDGPIVELTPQDDSFSPSEGADNSLQTVTSPADHSFNASRATAIQIRSVESHPCHANIYSRYKKKNGLTYIPDPTSRVMQINSPTCDYSGILYVMHHWESLLVEVIIIRQTEGTLQNGSTTYYEVALPSDEVILDVN